MIEPRAGALRDELGADADRVAWIDMERVGRNPARIIPVWQDWAERNGARVFRGIGEIAGNSIVHGGGHGTVAVWTEEPRSSARSTTRATSSTRSPAATAPPPIRTVAGDCGWPTSSATSSRSAPRRQQAQRCA